MHASPELGYKHLPPPLPSSRLWNNSTPGIYRASSFRRRPRCVVPHKREVLHYGGPGNHKSRMLDEVIKLNSPAHGRYTNNGSLARVRVFRGTRSSHPRGVFYDFCGVLRFIFIGRVTGSRAAAAAPTTTTTTTEITTALRATRKESRRSSPSAPFSPLPRRSRRRTRPCARAFYGRLL